MTIKVVTEYNNKLIKQHLEYSGEGYLEEPVRKHCEYIIQLKDEGVKKALIDLGWTPPKENI